MQPLGPEHPTDDSLVAVSYIEYEHLEDPGQFDGKELAALTASEDWKQQYDCLNLIRALNKHHRDYLLGGAEESLLSLVVAKFAREQIDNLRSNLAKCALMLVKEVFADGVKEGPDSRLRVFIRAVLPLTLLKTIFEKNFIALEAKKACE